jgi:hypothetical protein
MRDQWLETDRACCCWNGVPARSRTESSSFARSSPHPAERGQCRRWLRRGRFVQDSNLDQIASNTSALPPSHGRVGYWSGQRESKPYRPFGRLWSYRWQYSCVTMEQAWCDVRESNPSPSVHSRPSSQTSNVTTSGLSWTCTTFFRASAGRYHSTSSQPEKAGVRTIQPKLALPGGFATRHSRV